MVCSTGQIGTAMIRQGTPNAVRRPNWWESQEYEVRRGHARKPVRCRSTLAELPLRRKYEESNYALQNCQCVALCMGRRQYVWTLEFLAFCGADGRRTFPFGALRLFLRPGRFRLPGVLLFVCSVCGIFSLAFK